MQVQNFLIEEIKPLIYCYIFHLILYVLIFILHFILYYKLYWLNLTITKIFMFITYFGAIFYIIPLIQIILICKKYFIFKLFSIFKYISLIFFILSIIMGLLSSAILWFNTISSINFCKECPLTYTIANLNYTFSKHPENIIENENITDTCNIKRCILFKKNINEIYAYSYLCNYELNIDSENTDKNEYKKILPNGTELISENDFVCYELEQPYRTIAFNSTIYYKYLDTCFYLTNFYICKRFSEPKIYYTMQKNESCPEDNYMILLYILSVLIIITDIIISLLPWFIEYISFKRILLFLNSSNRTVNSITSTKKSTVNSNNPESFKKEETIIIIRPTIKEDSKKEDEIINENKKANNHSLYIKDSDNPFIIRKIDLHNKTDNKIDNTIDNKIDLIDDIKGKKSNNKANVKPLITEDSERNNFKYNKNYDNTKIKKAKTNSFLDEKDDYNNNIINVKKYKNEKKKK